eukprot:5992596-Amphidinium_carterae.1
MQPMTGHLVRNAEKCSNYSLRRDSISVFQLPFCYKVLDQRQWQREQPRSAQHKRLHMYRNSKAIRLDCVCYSAWV